MMNQQGYKVGGDTPIQQKEQQFQHQQMQQQKMQQLQQSSQLQHRQQPPTPQDQQQKQMQQRLPAPQQVQPQSQQQSQQSPLQQQSPGHTSQPPSMQTSPSIMNQNITNPRVSGTSDNLTSKPQQPQLMRTTVSQPAPSIPLLANPLQNPTLTLCKFGQDIIPEIVGKVQEMFHILKNLQPPNGTPAGTSMSNDKKLKIQEYLRNIKLFFSKLRIVYDKCNEGCHLQGMEYMHIESLIPLKEEWDTKYEERKTSETYRQVVDERNELMEQLQMKNRQLKEVIDNLRGIIWEINTMLAMRRS